MGLNNTLSLVSGALCCTTAVVLWVRGQRAAVASAPLLIAIGIWTSLPMSVRFFPEALQPTAARAIFSFSVLVAPLGARFGEVQHGERDWSRWTKLIWLGAVFFIAALWSGHLITGIRTADGRVFPIPGSLYIPYVLYFAFSDGYGMWNIFRGFQSYNDFRRSKTWYVFLGFLAAYLSGGLYFLALHTRRELISADIFVIFCVISSSYGFLKDRVMEMGLVTREAASRLCALTLVAVPFFVGRLLAHVLQNLGTLAFLRTLVSLSAALFFFAATLAMLREYENAHARRLGRFFLLLGLWNFMLMSWVVPNERISLYLSRTAYLFGCWVLLAWSDWRRGYSQAAPPARFGAFAWFRISAYVMMAFSALTPYVMQGIEARPVTLRYTPEIAGPGLALFGLWWVGCAIAVNLWLLRDFRSRQRLFASTPGRALVGATVSGIAAALAYFLFAAGRVRLPFFALLEILCGLCILVLFRTEPAGDRKAAPRSVGVVITSLVIPLIAGFFLIWGAWMQLLAGLLLVISVPHLLTEIEESVQSWVDQYLFAKKYSYLAEIKRLGEDIFRSADLPRLLKLLVEDLSQRAALEWVGVWLYEVTDNRFALRQASVLTVEGGASNDLRGRSFTGDDPLIQLFSVSRDLLSVQDAIVPVEDTPAVEAAAPLSRRAAESLAQANLSAALPIHWEDKLIGFLGLGPKRDHSLFHEADRASLWDLVQKAERAIGQAFLLYESSLVVSKLAHDNLNFLQTQGLALNTLEREMLGPLNERQRKQVQLSLQQKDLIQESLIDLRELERLVVLRMQGVWRMEPYNLEAVAQQAVQAQMIRAESQGVRLEFASETLPTALGDARAVRRVADNLILNALKFTPAGGRIRVELRVDGDNILLTISDTGPGIAAEALPRLFDPFYQAPAGRMSGKGTGLGLSVVRDVASLHRGRVRVESKVGVGTTFIVQLPSERRAAELASETRRYAA